MNIIDKKKIYIFILIVLMSSYLFIDFYSITFNYCIFNTVFTGTSNFFSFCVGIAIVMTAVHVIQKDYTFDVYDVLLTFVFILYLFFYFWLFIKGFFFSIARIGMYCFIINAV